MPALEEKNIIILAHIFTTVPARDLEEYFLNNKISRLLFIGHPLMYKKGRDGSYYRYYENGVLKNEVILKNRKIPSLLQYVVDTILSIFWVFKMGGTWDIIIALDNLNTMAALFLRIFHKTKKVIYYTIDFIPQRFENKALNNFYHYLDKLAVVNSDMVWNVSPRIKEGRRKIKGLYSNNQLTVPIGVWFFRIKRKKFEEIEKYTMIYAGGLLPHQGIQLVLEAIPDIIKTIPHFRFRIIGMGTFEEELKNITKKFKISQYVDFMGYIEKYEDVERELTKVGAAVGMYSSELDKWSYYADPSKIKAYLAAGLPVITTDLTHIAKQLESKKCGFVIKYDKKMLTKTIIKLMSNTKMYREYRDNAVIFSKNYDWNKVFSKALKEVL